MHSGLQKHRRWVVGPDTAAQVLLALVAHALAAKSRTGCVAAAAACVVRVVLQVRSGIAPASAVRSAEVLASPCVEVRLHAMPWAPQAVSQLELVLLTTQLGEGMTTWG